MPEVTVKFNQVKPISDRNRRRKSKPSKDYTGTIILLIFAVIALSIILTSCQEKKEGEEYNDLEWVNLAEQPSFLDYNIAVSEIGDTAFVDLRKNYDVIKFTIHDTMFTMYLESPEIFKVKGKQFTYHKIGSDTLYTTWIKE